MTEAFSPDKLRELFGGKNKSTEGIVLGSETKMEFKKIYLYSRVSSKDQGENGVSMAWQKNVTEKWAKDRGRTDGIPIKDESLSGGSVIDRPGMMYLLSLIRKGDVIVATSSDRIARNKVDYEKITWTLSEIGAYLVYTTSNIGTDTLAGQLQSVINSTINEDELKRIKERTRRCLQDLKEKDKLRTRPPFGKKFVSKDLPFVDNPEEIKVIEKMREFFTEDNNITDATMCRYLKSSGCKCRKEGGEWWSGPVQKIRIRAGIYPKEFMDQQWVQDFLKNEKLHRYMGGRLDRRKADEQPRQLQQPQQLPQAPAPVAIGKRRSIDQCKIQTQIIFSN